VLLTCVSSAGAGAAPSAKATYAQLRADVAAATKAQAHHKRLPAARYRTIAKLAKRLSRELRKASGGCGSALKAAQRLPAARASKKLLKSELRVVDAKLPICRQAVLNLTPTKPVIDGPPKNPPQAIVEAFTRTQHVSGPSFIGGPTGTSDFTDTMIGGGIAVPADPENPAESNPTECVFANEADNPKPPAGTVAVCNTDLEVQYTEHESFPSPCANQTYQVTFAAVDGPQNFLPVFLGPTVAQVDFYLDDHDNVISATILGFSQALLIGWDQFDPGIGDTCEMTENGPLPPLDLTKPLNASALNSGQPVTVSFDQTTNKNSLAYDVTWHSTISFRWVKDPPPQQPPG